MPFGNAVGQGFVNPVTDNFAAGNIRISRSGLFVYSGPPGAGNLVGSWTPSGGTDRYGNAYQQGLAVTNGTGTGVRLNGTTLSFPGIGRSSTGFLQSQAAGSASQRPQTMVSGASDNDGVAQILLGGESQDGTTAPLILLQGFSLSGNTGQPVQVNLSGGLAVRPGTGTAQLLSITGNSTGAGQLVYIEQDGTNDHALTVNLAGNGGSSQAAINAVSANTAFSCTEITGVEKNRGTLKIAHKGYADGSDTGAAALSIDLQTSSGTGTQAQGIFITSTTDSPYTANVNMICVRQNGLDEFVVKSQGVIGVGVATGHIPAGMLEIVQKDTVTPGVYMQALAGGTDLVQLKDSGGNLRWQVSNAGNMLARANTFFTTNAIIGSASSDFGGAGSALTICHSTDPSANPAAGHVIVYTDSAGNLLARTSAGNIRTIAAV